jgi:hypothetical protein
LDKAIGCCRRAFRRECSATSTLDVTSTEFLHPLLYAVETDIVLSLFRPHAVSFSDFLCGNGALLFFECYDNVVLL